MVEVGRAEGAAEADELAEETALELGVAPFRHVFRYESMTVRFCEGWPPHCPVHA